LREWANAPTEFDKWLALLDEQAVEREISELEAQIDSAARRWL
jgi:hypothetical protein